MNLSPDQLLDTELPARVRKLTQRYGIPAHQLVLEITERALLTDDPRATAVADQLVALGVTLSLDDFGTGYSSLAHLRGFPLASLKLDRSFLADIDTDPKAQPFLRAVVRLAKELGLRVIGEVERDCRWRSCASRLPPRAGIPALTAPAGGRVRRARRRPGCRV